MEKKICFKLEQRDDKYIIVPVMDNLPLEHTTGSFNLLPARLMGLDYANYLRMCRDMCGATIMGKGNKYPVAYFGGSPQAMIVTKQLVKLLNARANAALWDKEHPDLMGRLEEKLAERKARKELEDEKK